jgi:hypothetical protein
VPFSAWLFIWCYKSLEIIYSILLSLFIPSLLIILFSKYDNLQKQISTNNSINNDLNTVTENSPNNIDDQIIWNLVSIFYSVFLSFSISNASLVKIFQPGEFLYYLLNIKPVDLKLVFSSFSYLSLTIINFLILAYFLKNNYFRKFKYFYLNMIIVLIIGVTPMLVYYFSYLISKFLLGVPGL